MKYINSIYRKRILFRFLAEIHVSLGSLYQKLECANRALSLAKYINSIYRKRILFRFLAEIHFSLGSLYQKLEIRRANRAPSLGPY